MRDYARSKRDELSLLTACKRDVGAKSALFLGSCSSVKSAMLQSVTMYSYNRRHCSETLHISAAVSQDGGRVGGEEETGPRGQPTALFGKAVGPAAAVRPPAAAPPQQHSITVIPRESER